VDIVPRSHGALAQIGAHDARVELRHLVRMAGGLAAGLLGNGGVVAEGDRIAVMPHQCAHVIVQLTLCIARQHGAKTVITGWEQPLDMAFARHDVQVIVQHDELQHALVRFVGIVREAVAKVAVAAFGVGMAGLLLHLLAGHHELGCAQLGHAACISVTGDTSVAGLVAGIVMKECEQKDELNDQDDHPAAGAKEIPESADGHRVPSGNDLEPGAMLRTIA